MLRDDEERNKGKILQYLRNDPKGRTISEISRKISLNRNSTAKYLEILRVNGKVDMRSLGRAKVFYLSQRVPISALLDFSTDYILVLDSRMNIIDVNENLQRFLHVKKEMLLDVQLSSSNLPILTSKTSMKKIKKALKGEGSTFEMEIKMEDGMKYFTGKLIPSALGDGENGVTVIMENVTEQKLAEIKLIKSEERYRELIENQGEGVGLTDPDDVFIFANPAAERLMGVGPGKLVGRSVMDFLPASERKRILVHNLRRSKGKKDTYQVNILSGDGLKKTILLTATPRYDESGDFKGSFGVFRDITIMKENERRTKESEKRYRELFESTNDAILILKENRIIDCNNSTLTLFGYPSKSSLLGLGPEDLSPEFQENGDTSEMEVSRFLEEASRKGAVSFNWIHERKDGSIFHADIQLQPIKTGDEGVYQARMRDITDLVMARRELEDKKARLSSILSSLHGTFIGLLNRDLVFEEFWGTSELDSEYGIDGANLVGMSILDFTYEDRKEEVMDRVMNIFKDGKPFRIEHEAILPNGRFWQDWSFSPFRTKGGRVEYVVQFGRDTHEKNSMIKTLMDVERNKMEELKLKDRIMEGIAKISTIMLQDGNWKDKIVIALGNIGEAVNVSRVYIFRNRNDPVKGLLTSRILEWTDDGIEKQGDNPDLYEFSYQDGFDRWGDILRKGNAIKGVVSEFPTEERAKLESQGIKSIVVLPISIKDRWWGFIGLDDCINERIWSKEEIKALKLAGSMLGTVVMGHGI